MMFRAGYTEEVNRPEPEAVAGPSFERNLNLLVAVSPHTFVAPRLEASEVGCARTKKHARLAALYCHL